MDKKNTIRLIIWGLLFLITFGCGIIGLSSSKAKQKSNPYYPYYNNEDIYTE